MTFVPVVDIDDDFCAILPVRITLKELESGRSGLRIEVSGLPQTHFQPGRV